MNSWFAACINADTTARAVSKQHHVTTINDVKRVVRRKSDSDECHGIIIPVDNRQAIARIEHISW